MRPLARWSLARVLLVCIGWVVLWIVVPVLWVTMQLRSQMTQASAAGSGGLGAVSIGVSDLVVLGPPIVFWATWVAARRRTASTAARWK